MLPAAPHRRPAPPRWLPPAHIHTGFFVLLAVAIRGRTVDQYIGLIPIPLRIKKMCLLKIAVTRTSSAEHRAQRSAAKLSFRRPTILLWNCFAIHQFPLHRRARKSRSRLRFPAIETWKNQFPGLRNPDRRPRVHLRLPQDRPARLRRHPASLHASRTLPRAQVLEGISLLLPQPRHLPGKHRQPDPRRRSESLRPRSGPHVKGDFRPRGGISTIVEARWPRPESSHQQS